ncbi:Nif3-like dinuclear metal center hexameric protein [Tumebacillus permanentifrigoris]|uniref:GTP cyclohydrolase 1 type 2 homolog n=1 Tax=Tumebacillus permanentifrigoris TaxID=378543 RepID=A0A316DSB0_9BACL|nr:Nif3-like dinuclear metal center hexameric protein [Tumebacillus permanentifrigoris]PWK08425.1 dinuclear metal center YbgI/SA1388 family protein [Tumebacillus permanentifrigoris]
MSKPTPNLATVRQVTAALEEMAPLSLAESWDKVGLQVGDPTRPVRKVLLSLDSNVEGVIDEAIAQGVDLIIAHHAMIFKAVQTLRTDTPYGRKLQKLLANGIGVYVAHTNLDIAEGGINDILASRLHLENVDILTRVHNTRLKKLVVFVPETHHEQVRQAVSAAGAGWIGNYSNVSFNTPGVGMFVPEQGTNPYVGEQGKLERVNEIRLETVVPEHIQDRVIAAMIAAHPYEEVAYDLYPLEIMGKVFGVGRVGDLVEEMTLAQFAEFVKQQFEVEHARVVGPLDRKIRRVAVLGGSGEEYFPDALKQGADVFVTGDIRYHYAQDAEAEGLCMVDPGHNTEKVCLPSLRAYLEAKMHEYGFETEILVSQTNTEPFRFV